MKKILLFAAVSLSLTALNAQNEKFVNAMTPKVAAVDTTTTAGGLTDLANAFERIANAEKTEWLPFYYAALCNVRAGYSYSMSGNIAPVDALADKAEALLTTAASLTADNSEIHCIKKMIITLRVMVDPMSRYQDLPKAAEELATAKKLNPENPRVPLLEGQDKFFTPEQFGGSKDEAKVLFAEAITKFEAFKPANPLDPTWGAGQAKYFAELANK